MADRNDSASPTELAPAGVTAAIVDRVSRLAAHRLPENVQTLGKQCMLDWFAVAIAGSREPLVRLLIQQADEEGSKPAATVVRGKHKVSVRQAALINGAMGHALDYDDVNVAGHGHITAAVLPAAIAVAEDGRRSGAQLLAGFVAGYEAAVMVGRFVGREHYERGFHATATIGTYGAASASALLMGLDAEAYARALGIAGTQAAGLKSQFGTMCKPLHAGKANENGVFGAQLARRGFTGRTDILECVQGFADTQSPGGDARAALVPARAGAHIADNLFKFSAACYGTHGAIIAARQLMRDHKLSVTQIRRVELRVEPGADKMCNIAIPSTGLQAKFSLRFNAALALAGDDTASPETYTDALTQRADLCALRDRVVVRCMPAGWPLCLTEIDLELTDGRVLKASHDTGTPAQDLAEQGERLQHKFDALVEPILGPARSARLAGAIREIEQLADIGELMELVR